VKESGNNSQLIIILELNALRALHNISMKCPRCESIEISKNGTRNNKQNFICKQCGRQFVEYSSARGYSAEIRQICLRMRRQGMAYRKIEELTGVSHNTVIAWDKEANDGGPSSQQKLLLAQLRSIHET
jgi:transposase-like protein